MTDGPRHRSRFITGRPRKSTLVLIGLFIGFLALYILVRPESAASTNTGNVQQVNPGPTQPTPTYTQPPRTHTESPAPTHSVTPSETQTPSHTPTPVTGTSTGTGTATATPTTSSSTTVTSPASLPTGTPVQ